MGQDTNEFLCDGGQTTVSLFHTRKRDKADLSQIFVQMKLSVIDSQQSEMVVPKISEYANTRNRVNAADFFSNHPFHVSMEGFSRRIWAPAQEGAPRETRWFYERMRPVCRQGTDGEGVVVGDVIAGLRD